MDRIDRYELLASLGQGATGIVYLARDTKLDQEVALKVISPEVASNPAIRSLFHREARAISKLRHPNIIALHDYSGPDSETIYLVVERLSGITLFDLVEKKPLDFVTAAAAGHELCLALDHAHQTGIIHRDLKPENVFLEPDGRIVLCDFGIARDYQSGIQNTLASQKTTLAGSPLYMSPEQILTPQKVGPASDLFSLGSVLYYLASAAHAFDAPTMPKVLKAVSAAKYQSLDSARTDVPMPYVNIVHRLLQKDPVKRFASARQVAEQLLAIVRASPLAEPRFALQAAQKKSPGLTTSQLIPLEALSADPRHTMVMLRQKKIVSSGGAVRPEPQVKAGPPARATQRATPEPHDLLVTVEIGKSTPAPKPRSVNVLFWAMIVASSIVVLGLLVAELDAMRGVRAWLQRIFGG